MRLAYGKIYVGAGDIVSLKAARFWAKRWRDFVGRRRAERVQRRLMTRLARQRLVCEPGMRLVADFVGLPRFDFVGLPDLLGYDGEYFEHESVAEPGERIYKNRFDDNEVLSEGNLRTGDYIVWYQPDPVGRPDAVKGYHLNVDMNGGATRWTAAGLPFEHKSAEPMAVAG